MLLNVPDLSLHFLGILHYASNRARYSFSQQYTLAKFQFLYMYLINKIKNQAVDITLNSLCCQIYLAFIAFLSYFPPV